MFSLSAEQAAWDDSQNHRATSSIDLFHVVGFNFRTTGLDTRSRLCFAEDGLRAILQTLGEHGLAEAVVLCTCNRTEIYFCAEDSTPVFGAIAQQSELERDRLQLLSYERSGEEAVKHLFRVSSGMDSAALGETEIASQVKDAFGASAANGMTGAQTAFLFQRAMRVSKRVRTESGICKEVTSIAGMAVKLAEGRVGSLARKSVLIVGAGHMAERVAKEVAPVAGHLRVVNRTATKAEHLASGHNAEVGLWESLDRAIDVADVVFLTVSTEFPLVDSARIDRLDRTKGRLFVDLGVPANVEEVPAGQLIDMDEISRNCEASSQSRRDSLPEAEAIVEAEWLQFRQESMEREASPQIKELAEYAEQVRIRNLAWATAQLKNPSPAELKLLEDLSIRLVRGMLEAPINALKKELRDPAERAVVARLFKDQRNPA